MRDAEITIAGGAGIHDLHPTCYPPRAPANAWPTAKVTTDESDGLWAIAFNDIPHCITADNRRTSDQDQAAKRQMPFSAGIQQKAVAAQEQAILMRNHPGQCRQRQGDGCRSAKGRKQPRAGHHRESLGRLRAPFRDGSVTAGNASSRTMAPQP